jgi:uncharacterized protein (DUF885 family)
LLEGYRLKCQAIKNVLPKYFNVFPSSPLEIVRKDAPTAPAAYYLAGTPDGSRPGRFYVNVSNINARPKYEMTSLALHEAIPGHHHQCALALENVAIPDFLRFLEDRRYEFCPARRQLYAAYLEGWALYCEALGEEMGLYTTPLELFGKLSMEIAIWKMRHAAEEKLGSEGFNLKDFHDVVLNSGPLPLDALERMVEEWVVKRLNGGGGGGGGGGGEASKKKRRTC